jgi:hypothetical protein
MVTLDSFLNFAVPLGIVLFFVGLLYSKLKNEIHAFINWIKRLFDSGVDNIPEPRSHIIYDG